ncbi:hypothetical protein [Paenibacillus sabinae]|nr:hypothetical protein [Paenibacillus sabinae]
MTIQQPFASLIFIAAMFASGLYWRRKETHNMCFYMGIAIIAMVSMK